MSKKYIYQAKKRGSPAYNTASYISGCKIGCSHHYTNCRSCLHSARLGVTRQKQQAYDKNKKLSQMTTNLP